MALSTWKAIAGHAVAGGLELALWCDLRVADETATFGVYCRRWGVPLIDGGTVRLPRLVGTGRAMDLILTGRSVDAAEALAIGLVNRLVPAGEALTTAQGLARQLAAFPQTCLREDRASVLEQEGLDEAAALANEFRHGRTSLAAETLAGPAVGPVAPQEPAVLAGLGPVADQRLREAERRRGPRCAGLVARQQQAGRRHDADDDRAPRAFPHVHLPGPTGDRCHPAWSGSYCRRVPASVAGDRYSWMPHSVLSRPAQRPDRGSLGSVGRSVHGSHPIDV